jgi:hypothetical protein
VSSAPTVEQVTARLRSLGLDEARASTVAPELARRLALLASAQQAGLERVAPALEFTVVPLDPAPDEPR